MIRRPIAALPFLFLAACAQQPVEPMVTKVTATPPGGLWEVTQAAAIEPSPTPVASPYLGQKMMLSADAAGDPAGRLCKMPNYQGWDSTPASVLGTSKGDAARSNAMRPVLGVMCEGQGFGTYVSQPDGSLSTRVNNWVLTLNRVEPPKPMALAPEPAPEPTPVAAPAPAPAPAPTLDKRTLVYLASYKTEAKAMSGWKVLVKASPILNGQKPVTQPIDLGPKGKWIRLYGMAADEEERAKLCKQLSKLVDECGARNRE